MKTMAPVEICRSSIEKAVFPYAYDYSQKEKFKIENRFFCSPKGD